MRILYHAACGGIGRLTRLAAVAVAVQQQAPDVHQLVATATNDKPLLDRLCMPALILPADDGEPPPGVDRRLRTISAELARRILTDTVRAYDPKVLVFDTDAPAGLTEEARRDGRHSVLVLPHRRGEVLAKMLRDGVLSAFDLVLVPHPREQMAAILSPSLFRRLDRLPAVRYVDGIVIPEAIHADSVRGVAARHAIGETTRLILVCAVAGRFDPSWVIKACRAAAARRRTDPAVRVICAAGPGAELIATPPGCTMLSGEPGLPLLMARADLVVTHGGCNSVQDVLRAGTRALLVPEPSTVEDQAAFIASLLPRPGMRTLPPGAPEAAFGRAMHQLLREPRPSPVGPAGAQLAARAILEIGGLPEVYICRRAPADSVAAGRRAGPGELSQFMQDGFADARLCLDWDVAAEVLTTIGPEARSRVVSIEIHLGTGTVDEWEDRMRRVHGLIEPAGFDPGILSFCLEDGTADAGIAGLSERIGDLRFRVLVAQVPLDALRARPDIMLEEAERCRALDLGFGIDISLLENPLPFVDQP